MEIIMKKKQANPEESIGYKELDKGDIEWITPNFDIYIENAIMGNQAFIVNVFDSKEKDDNKALQESREFYFWWEVLEYIEGWK